MNKNYIILLFFIYLSTLNSQAERLDNGTQVTLVTKDVISSKYDLDGVVQILYDVCTPQGEVLIKSGTPVFYSVDRKKAKGVGRPGNLNINFISTTAVDGRVILLRGNKKIVGQSKKGLAIGLGVGLGVTVLPGIGLGFLGIKGKEAILPSEMVINNIYVANTYEINIQ